MRMRALVLAVWILCGMLLVAAGPPPIIAPPPDAEELSRRRAALARAIGDGVVIVDAHGTGEGSQVDRDFYYLAGVEVGGGRLVLRIVEGQSTSTWALPTPWLSGKFTPRQREIYEVVWLESGMTRGVAMASRSRAIS